MCQAFLLDEHNRIRRNRAGEPLHNPAPPKCGKTPCWALGKKRPRFGAYDLECYRRWQLCRAFHAWPLPGGLPDQNPWDMDRFRILENFERSADRKFAASIAMLSNPFLKRK